MWNNLKWRRVWPLVLGLVLSLGQPVLALDYALDSIKTPDDWFNLDPEENGVMGTSVNKAYELLLKDKTPKQTVVVAVIDSGVDIEHEDLQGKIWVNRDEIPGNGKDDDGNGYVDDVNGWNFIGGKDGRNVSNDTYELTREYVRLKPLYESLSPDDVKRRDRNEYDYWLTIRDEFEETRKEAEMNLQFASTIQDNLKEVARILRSALDKEEIRAEDLRNMQHEDERIVKTAEMVLQLFEQMGTEETTFRDILEGLAAEVDYYSTQVEYAYNPEFDPRYIVGDDPDNYRERHYGNNDVVGPDASHGTHVAGIIAADRHNDLGMRGISDHALIMPVRAVPDGDERDKDVANAIYYAVDNGADIINMSFGKSYSPGKKYVDKAVRYAKRKGVLLIHAAGNSGEEVDRCNNFPNKWVGRRRVAPNWVEVGASSWLEDENLPGSFTNYSGKSVDFFAPGVEVYSTVPGNEYEANSGTSMAAPVVSGITALIMAYYPDLKPSEIREILHQSVYLPEEDMVNKPGDGEEVDFDSLSITGGLVNAYRALKLAQTPED